MSSHPISKSSTLKGPKFEDEIEVQSVSPSTPMEKWKVLPRKPMKKDLFQDRTLESKDTFLVKTENRFSCIGDQFCDPFHIENTEPDVNNFNKPLQNKLKKKRIKKIKQVRKMKKYCITNPIRAPHSLDELEVIRCNKCFVNHFPSLPKFCRWAKEHADKVIKKSMKDESTGSKKINSSSNYIEMIKTRINLIEEQLHPKCTSPHDIKNQNNQKIQREKDKVSKLIRTPVLENIYDVTENAESLFGCYPSQPESQEPPSIDQKDKCKKELLDDFFCKENIKTDPECELIPQIDGCHDDIISEDEDSIQYNDDFNNDDMDKDDGFIPKINGSNDESIENQDIMLQSDVSNDVNKDLISHFFISKDEEHYSLPQLDGCNDEIDDLIEQLDGNSIYPDDDIPQKDVFSINSEIHGLICLVNFFRGCDFLWKR